MILMSQYLVAMTTGALPTCHEIRHNSNPLELGPVFMGFKHWGYDFTIEIVTDNTQVGFMLNAG